MPCRNSRTGCAGLGRWSVITLSNRWFPPKVVRIWQQLHDFEPMGLVPEYLADFGRYHNLGTYSMRGIPRPREDKYYPRLGLSVPVFAVWG